MATKFNHGDKVRALIAMWRDVRMAEVARRAYAHKADEFIKTHRIKGDDIIRYQEDVAAWRHNIRLAEDAAAIEANRRLNL